MGGLGPYVRVERGTKSAPRLEKADGMDVEGILAITLIFGGGTLFLLSISPVGKALADRLRGNVEPAQDPELLAEVDALRQEVADLQERVDFAERILLKGQGNNELGKGESAG
jgi:hypothetical protein